MLLNLVTPSVEILYSMIEEVDTLIDKTLVI